MHAERERIEPHSDDTIWRSSHEALREHPITYDDFPHGGSAHTRSARSSHVPYWYEDDKPHYAPDPHPKTMIALNVAPSYAYGGTYAAQDDQEERLYQTLLKLTKIITVLTLILLLVGCMVAIMRKDRASAPDAAPIVHTQRRTPLHEVEAMHAYDPEEDASWFDDQIGWIDDGETLVRGMWSFYSKTGVRPYLIITDDIDGKTDIYIDDATVESYMRSRYDGLFGDDDSLILLFFEPDDDNHNTYLLIGENATKVVDPSSEQTIYQAVERWYTDDSLDDNQYFSLIFAASADAIMNGTSLSEYDGITP